MYSFGTVLSLVSPVNSWPLTGSFDAMRTLAWRQ
jgi:hypothetical protein